MKAQKFLLIALLGFFFISFSNVAQAQSRTARRVVVRKTTIYKQPQRTNTYRLQQSNSWRNPNARIGSTRDSLSHRFRAQHQQVGSWRTGAVSQRVDPNRRVVGTGRPVSRITSRTAVRRPLNKYPRKPRN